jgi:hypothetical protein
MTHDSSAGHLVEEIGLEQIGPPSTAVPSTRPTCEQRDLLAIGELSPKPLPSSDSPRFGDAFPIASE